MKVNSYFEYLDTNGKVVNYRISSAWKDLEKYFDYILNDCFLPNGEHLRQEVWDFKYWVEESERQYEIDCGQLFLQNRFTNNRNTREYEALFLVYGKGKKEKVPEPDERDKEFRDKLFAI